MEYVTLAKMCQDIRNNIWKIPRDIMGVVGVPRSGMFAATIISEFLNVGLASVEEFISAEDHESIFRNNHGNRVIKPCCGNKILVVDDTCFAGSQNLRTRNKINSVFQDDDKYDFIYLVVYMEGDGQISMPDLYLCDLRPLAKKSEFGIVLYEWNIFNHNPRIVDKMMFDYDGVFCLDPPDERNTLEYENYIKNPTPLFLPTNNANAKITVVTYRLEKYRNETESFLLKNGITSFNVMMYNASTYQERKAVPPSIYKANIYKQSNAALFVESNEQQAKEIHIRSGKPVYCVETNKIYQ